VSYLPPLRDPVRRIGRRTFDFAHQIAVMGIVNRTPDSFFDEGKTYRFDQAVGAAVAADEAGASFVDIGGVPFSPDTPEVSEELEIERVVPVVEAVAAASDIPISVDTFRPEVAARSIAVGASVINDTTGLRDPDLAAVIASGEVSIVITHSLAEPRRHLPRPRYDDIAAEVKHFLVGRVERAVDAGIPETKIILDPGHDLNKNTLHSLELSRRLTDIADIGLPLLVAVSNKDFVSEATGVSKSDRLAPSIAASTVCALNGARIVRMHDVASAVAAARMVEAILGFREPAFLRHNLA
jgi:dihydropteroate synthase